jgi:hypothetical protein
MENTINHLPKLSDYYVLYVDVLGYSEHLKLFPNTQNEYLLSIMGMMNRATQKNWKGIKKTVFSDCIAVGIKKSSKAALERLCKYASRLEELVFREDALLLRGGITLGKAYFGRNFVFGPALVRAVNIEEKEAFFSRIVLDQSLSSETYFLTSKHTLLEDPDDYKKYINFMNYYSPEINQKDSGRSRNLVQLRNSANKIFESFDESLKQTRNEEERDKLMKKKFYLIDIPRYRVLSVISSWA